MIQVGFIDDHQILINGLVKVVEADENIKVTFQSTNATISIDSSILNTLDILFLDVEMPHKDGIEIAKEVLLAYPDTKIIMLTMYNDVALAEQCRTLGVRGFVSKNIDEQLLINTIHKVYNGETSFDLLQYSNAKNQEQKIFYTQKIKELSNREIEILKYVVKGLSNTQIGEKLYISPRTVDTHRTNMMRKLEVTNVASLVRIALKSGLLI